MFTTMMLLWLGCTLSTPDRTSVNMYQYNVDKIMINEEKSMVPNINSLRTFINLYDCMRVTLYESNNKWLTNIEIKMFKKCIALINNLTNPNQQT